jgi:hypothetical protein
MKVNDRTTAYQSATTVNPTIFLSRRFPASHKAAAALKHLLSQYSLKNKKH